MHVILDIMHFYSYSAHVHSQLSPHVLSVNLSLSLNNKCLNPCASNQLETLHIGMSSNRSGELFECVLRTYSIVVNENERTVWLDYEGQIS